MRMTRFSTGLLLLSLVALGAGCASPTDVEVSDLQGRWLASEARFVDLEIPKENNTDIIQLGYTVVFVSDGSGDFVLRLDDPEDETRFIRGTMAIDGTDVVVETDDATGSGEVFLQDEQVALSLTAGLTFDFKGDGTERPAKLTLVMDRQSTEPGLE